MKTAISLPDPLFQKLDAEARRRGVSRSKLVSLSLEAFLESQSAPQHRRKLEAAIDAALDGIDSSLPDDLRAYQGRRLGESPEAAW